MQRAVPRDVPRRGGETRRAGGQAQPRGIVKVGLHPACGGRLRLGVEPGLPIEGGLQALGGLDEGRLEGVMHPPEAAGIEDEHRLGGLRRRLSLSEQR